MEASLTSCKHKTLSWTLCSCQHVQVHSDSSCITYNLKNVNIVLQLPFSARTFESNFIQIGSKMMLWENEEMILHALHTWQSRKMGNQPIITLSFTWLLLRELALLWAAVWHVLFWKVCSLWVTEASYFSVTMIQP